MSIENYLIEHCSPTLASLKTANLFNCRLSGGALYSQLEEWRACLEPKGIGIFVLRESESGALVYVARLSMLQRDLNLPGVADFLKEYGYENADVYSAIECLKSRLAVGDGFPHEIGVFLGYPLEDVKGFIELGGRNCKCTGCWKVYCNEYEAVRTFNKFKKCSAIYKKMWLQGRSVAQLTVAA